MMDKMIAPIPALTLSGGHILVDGRMEVGAVALQNGQIAPDTDPAAPQLDVSGYLVLPGIIDLHGDAFEHHLAPRPTAPFPIAMGLAGTDRDAAANGVTTAWMAQSWSWEGGHRGPDFAVRFLEAHQACRASLLTDLRVQIRCETHTVDTRDRLLDAIRTYGVDYLIFNNHLDEAVAMAAANPERVAAWAGQAGRTAQAHIELVYQTLARSAEVPGYLADLATVLGGLGVRIGSHDDADPETRERFAAIGARVCEFPTSVAAAACARAAGDPVLMGAPNVVRGGSQSGNIAATALIDEGLCSVLVSDYHYPTLHKAAFCLVDRGMALPEAWAMISGNAATVMGLTDRGTITPGKRADLAIINAETRMIEGTMAAGRWSHLSAGLAHRLMNLHPAARMAAE